MRQIRQLLSLVMAVLLVTTGLPALADNPGFAVAPTCLGNGFVGTISKAGAEAGFESCSTPTTIHTEILDSNGNIVIEINMDEVLDTIDVRVDGIVVDGNMTAAEAAQVASALDTPEGDLVRSDLHGLLQIEGGYSPTFRPMVGVALTRVVYEWAVASDEPAGGCHGCCGIGCGGCSGCYTSACLALDQA